MAGTAPSELIPAEARREALIVGLVLGFFLGVVAGAEIVRR